jgi:hypothetical protein
MEQSLSLSPVTRPVARIAFARLLQTIGWAGLAGIVLLVAAVVVAGKAWSLRADVSATLRSTLASKQSPQPSAEAPQQQFVGKLPGRGDISLLLTRFERAAVDNGLPWTSAEYRFVPASGKKAASLEVRCAFKAPYPKLRAMLADLIGSLPALTIREMTFSRQSIDTPDVDAKFVIAVFLADDDSLATSSGER